ncbi:MAG: MFS transporter [Eubacteriales bacterium]|nr:MFS transporter [Eubacteriales bacterium]
MEQGIGKKRSYYYVVIVAVCVLMMAMGTQASSGFSLMLKSIRDTAGLNGTQTSSIISVKNLSAFILVFFADKYFGKLGMRLGITFALLAGLLAYIVFAFAGTSLAIYYVAGIILGGAYAYCMALPMALLMRTWFNKFRPLAMSICAAGTGLSTFVLSKVVQRTINEKGINSAFYLMAILFAATAVICFLFIRNKPEDVGLEICGGEDWVDEKKLAKDAEKANKPAIAKTSKKAVWIFLGATILVGLYAAPSQQHFVIHFNDLGYDSMMVATAYSYVGLVGMIAKPTFGVLSTRIKYSVLCCVFLGVRVLALAFCFFGASMGLISWIPFVVCMAYAFGAPTTQLGYTNWMADFCTKEDYAKKVKNAQFCYQGAEILGAMIPGVIFDLTGHYTGYFGLASVLALIVVVVVAVMYMSRKKIMAQAEAEVAAEAAAAGN